MTSPETVFIPCSDGYPLSATFYTPGAAPLKGSVLLVPAMGTSQAYYSHFATWLTEQGYAVATFDYRGMGLSRKGSLRGFNVNIMDWARLDVQPILNELKRRNPGVPCTWIGHSLGGQFIPLVPGHETVRKIITVATGSGYWLENAMNLRYRVWWLWFFVVPVAVRIFGYFPGRKLKKVGDLPAGVVLQWRKWCLNRDYIVGVEGAGMREKFASVKVPMTSISFEDDELMSARNISSIHDFYVNSPRTMRRFRPSEFGLKRIGHFGFFKRASGPALWPRLILDELNAPA